MTSFETSPVAFTLSINNSLVRRRPDLRLIALAGLIATLIGCLKPSDPGPTPAPTPTAAQAATVTSVAVGGGNTGTVGQTSQLSATATMSDGTTQVVTGQATWESTNASIVSVSASGLATFVAPGEAELKATYRSITGSARATITAAPKPSSRLRPDVRIHHRPDCRRVHVRIMDGTDAPLDRHRRRRPVYFLRRSPQVWFTIKVTHSGYEDQTQLITLNGDLQTDFVIKPLLDLTGNYGNFGVSISVTSQTCEFPPFPDSSGSVRLTGKPDGTEFTLVITERGTSRTYDGEMDNDGGFSATGRGVFAGLLPTHGPSVVEFMHDFSGSVSGTARSRSISGAEHVTPGDPCPPNDEAHVQRQPVRLCARLLHFRHSFGPSILHGGRSRATRAPAPSTSATAS